MDNPTAPISPISPQPAISSPAESPNRRWLLWSVIGLTFLIFGIAIGVFGVKFLNQSLAQPPGNFVPTSESVIPTPSSDAKEPEKCLTVVGPCILKGCDYNPQQCAVSSQNTCSVDQDCGLNICNCLALPKGAIAIKDKICDLACSGTPRCINGRCQLVND